MGDLLFITFEGAPRGALATEIQRSQQMPDMSAMIAYARQILNQQCHPRKRPKIRAVTPRDRPFEQGVDELAVLVVVESPFTARSTFAHQCCLTTLMPSVLPTARRLSTHSDTPCDLRPPITLFKPGR